MFLQQVKASQENKDTLEKYGIPYTEANGFTVEFAKEEHTGSFTRFVGETEHHIFSYAPYAGLVVVFQKEASNGLKPGDIVQRKGETDGQPLLIDSISPPEPERGLPYEYIGVRSALGSYGFYAHELEPFDVKSLHEGELQLLQYLNR